MSSNQIISSNENKDFNKLTSIMDYQMIKRKVHGMAETEPKKAKLDLCPSQNNASTGLIDYQQVIKNDKKSFYGENNGTKNECEQYEQLKNGQTISPQIITTNGKSLNNNNLNTLNLNSLKNEFSKQGGEQSETSNNKLSETNSNTLPSHVVHLRNVPSDSNEQEILNFGSTFGTTVNCLLLKGKNQAFLEFADLESAKSMISYSNLTQQSVGGEVNGNGNGKPSANGLQSPTIRGRQIFVQYSNYKKLQKSNEANGVTSQTTVNNSSNQTPQSSSTQQLSNSNSNTIHHNNQVKSNSHNNHQNSKSNEDIIICNNTTANQQTQSQTNQITVQTLLGNSANQSQSNKNLTNTISSITMGGATQQTTTHNNNSHNAINNSNSTLSTQSQPSSVLRVIVDNMMYLVPLETFHDLFSRFGKVTKIVTFNKNGIFQALIQFESSSSAAGAKAAYDGQQMFASGNLLRIDYSKLSNLSVKYNNEKSRDFTNSTLPAGPTLNTSSVLNNVTRNGSITNATANSPLVASNPMSSLNAHLNTQQLAIAAAAQHQQHYQHLEHVFSDPLALAQLSSFTGLTNSLPYSNLRSTLNAQTNGTHHNSLSNMLANGTAGVNLSSVLLVSNLSEQMATPDALFTLFGVYGDVIRVKILFNKQDNALIQMSDATQAQLVINYLDKLNLFGNVLKISISKYSNVQMPKEGQPDSGLTKDYTSSPLHRFKKPGSKNYQNIFPPSPTLHLSNIPSTCTEQKLREAFEAVANSKVINFKFFPNDQKMALIQLASIEDAVSALIKMHNYQLSESNHLRVSFSKSSI